MTIRNPKLYLNRRRGIRLEALEKRQLLASITGDGIDDGEILHEPSGHTLDLVRMSGPIVEVTADFHQITRVSFFDLNGDLVAADFSGAGVLTVFLDDFSGPAPADPNLYNLADEYVTGKASFQIVGSDESTFFSVFTIGTVNEFPEGIILGAPEEYDGVADITRLVIVENPSNPIGSNFAGISMANTRFTGSTGSIGITAINVQVQRFVEIGDLDASDSGVPTLLFGLSSQFGTIQVSGGDLSQSNGLPINESGFSTVNFVAGGFSNGIEERSSVFGGTFLNNQDGIARITLVDGEQTFNLDGKTQGEIDDFFIERTFTGDVTVNGDLTDLFHIDVEAFRQDITFTGDIIGDGDFDNIDIIIRAEDIGGTLTFEGGVGADALIYVNGEVGGLQVGTVGVNADLDGRIIADSFGLGTGLNVAIYGNLDGLLTTDSHTFTEDNIDGTDISYDGEFTDDADEGGIGDILVTGDLTGEVQGILGIGNVTVGGELSGLVSTDGLNSGWSGILYSIGDVDVTGDLSGDVRGIRGINSVTIGGDFTGLLTTDETDDGNFDNGEGAIGNIDVTGDFSGRVVGISGIGDVEVGGNLTTSDDGGGAYAFYTSSSGGAFANIGATTIKGDVLQTDNAGGGFLRIDNNGNFGNITVEGGGGSRIEFGDVRINGDIAPEPPEPAPIFTGTISITGTGNDDPLTGGINEGEIDIYGINIATGNLGDITVTGSNGTDTRIDFNDEIIAQDENVGNITVSRAREITLDGSITGESIGNIRFTTIAGTADDPSSITLGGPIGTSNGDLGNVTLDAGANFSTVTINSGLDIDGGDSVSSGTIDITAEDIVLNSRSNSEGAFGDINLTGDVTFNDNGFLADSIGNITVNSDVELNAVTAFEATDGNIGNVSVDGDVFGNGWFLETSDEGGSIGTVDVEGNFGDLVSIRTVNGDIGAITIGGNLGLLDNTSFTIDGRLDSLTVEGVTTLDSSSGANITFDNSGKLWFKDDFDSSAGSFPAIVADDGTAAVDIIDEMEFNSLVTGYADIPDNVDSLLGIDVVASRIGNVTFEGRLLNSETLVRDFGILARPNSTGTTNADVLTTEQVNLDGSNLSEYTIGNITVKSTLQFPWTGTSLFGGANFFIALGGIGDIDLIGGAKGNQHTALFDDSFINPDGTWAAPAPAAWFVAGDVDGLDGSISAGLPAATLGTGATAAADTTAPNYTGGTVSIGNVTVNTLQSDTTANLSGVDHIAGSPAWDPGFEGLGILSGVRPTGDAGQYGRIIWFNGSPEAQTDFVEIDADLAGDIGDIFIRSAHAIAFRDDALFVDIDIDDAVPSLIDTAFSGIVLSGQTGTIQLVAGLDTPGQATILGDLDATADDEIDVVWGDDPPNHYDVPPGPGSNEIVIVVV